MTLAHEPRNGSASPPRKSRSASSRVPKGSISASVVYARMDKTDQALAAVQRQGTDTATRVDQFQQTIQRVETKMDSHVKDISDKHNQIMEAVAKLTGFIGEEREDGEGGVVGTGLMGRMRRAENGILKMITTYKAWITFGMGFVCCGGAMVAMLWWLIGDKLAVVLK